MTTPSTDGPSDDNEMLRPANSTDRRSADDLLTDGEHRQVSAIATRLADSPYEHHRELAAALRRIEARRRQREGEPCPPSPHESA